MKLFPLIALGLTSVISLAASAKPAVYKAVIRAELEAQNSDNYISGSLFQDGRKGLIEVTLQPKMPECPEGFMCPQVMPEAISYTLEGAKSEVDHCGIITTRAEHDNRPADGIYLAITVRNNRNNTCPTLGALKPLEVSVDTAWYSRLDAAEGSTNDNFTAEDFATIKPGKGKPGKQKPVK